MYVCMYVWYTETGEGVCPSNNNFHGDPGWCTYVPTASYCQLRCELYDPKMSEKDVFILHLMAPVAVPNNT